MIQTLLSAPPEVSRFLNRRALENGPAPLAAGLRFVGHDPVTRRLGSGGGTVNLLWQAWQALPTRSRPLLLDWLATNPSVVLHAGGESRRLPAYAALGKAFMPVPIAGSAPRRVDQTLADFQLPLYSRVLEEARGRAAVLVASGDVWLDLNALQIPAVNADIAGVGMRVSPEIAQHFGVFFVGKSTGATREEPISFFLQKPAPAEIYRRLSHYDFFVDTGLWLLSLDAVRLLFARCGWDDAKQHFATPDALPSYVDLYTELGVALGAEARAPAALQKLGWQKLRSSVIPLENARFLHLGSSRQLFESFEQLSRFHGGQSLHYCAATPPAAFTQRGRLPVWVDGVASGAPLVLDGFNVVTGRPRSAGALHLAQEQCLDVIPVGPTAYVVRPYLLDDTLRGTPQGGARICGQPAAEWLARRGFAASNRDVFELAIYPVVDGLAIDQSLLDWFFSSQPNPTLTARLAEVERIAASAIPRRVNFTRYFADRRAGQAAMLRVEFDACLTEGDTRVFAQDFAAVAEFCHQHAPSLGRWLIAQHRTLLARVSLPEHQARLLSLLAQLSRDRARAQFAARASRSLQAAIVSSTNLSPTQPRLALKEDQIVWSRSPARLDLAGGWTDTPPYCHEHGGSVLNVAVLLNGQPPIQVFIRPLDEPVISLRSIDLGASERIESYRALSTFRDPRSGFSLPKASLALAGFLPEFAAGKAHPTLRSRLKAFGAGLELSLLSAVPKGSGLGTSSILGATLLGALNRACGLGWDEVSLYNRVLALEQLLTTGGGWQDQAGALFRGVKLVQTSPGPAQTPSVRFLPAHLFDASHANQTLLLYYTGITRLAKGILKEIVESMFLGRFETLQTLNFIRANSLELFNALQQGSQDGLHRCIARSWELNKALDPGTSTPEIEKILAHCGPDLAAAKLLGAGGGGYMLLCARDSAGGRRIRERLEANPPNRRARFIDFHVADAGLQVTVS